MLKKLYIILLFVLGTTYFSFGQCLCGSIFLELKVNDLQVVDGVSNYSFRFEEYDAYGNQTGSSRFQDPIDVENLLEDGKLKFSYATNGGIGMLKLIIKDKTTNEEMVVTTTSLMPDYLYYIDLLEFKSGHYLFDLDKIMKCIRERDKEEVIECGVVRFSLQKKGNSPRSIQPLDINDFRINDVELIKVPATVGLGTLEISFDLPVPFYLAENDEIPIDTLTFRYDEKKGIWHYGTHLKSFNPYRMFGGDSHVEAMRHIDMGLMSFPPVLSFRVVEESDCCYHVVVDESSFETVIIRKDPNYAILTNRNLLDESSSKNKRYYIYETWEHLLLRAEFVYFHNNYTVYDTPNGKKAFEKTGTKFLPYKVTEVQGEWIKVKKALGYEFNFEGITNAEGWVKWKNDTEIIVEIIKHTIE